LSPQYHKLPTSKKVIYTYESRTLNEDDDDSDEEETNHHLKKGSPDDSKYVILDPSPPTHKGYA